MQTNPYQNMIYNQPQGYMPQQYGYSPYIMPQRYQPQQIQEQMQPQSPRGINGKVVQSVEMITANDVPMDGSVAIFPMQDMSVIFAKSWNADGTIKTIAYKPDTSVFGNTITDNSGNSANVELRLSDEVTATFMGKFNELSERLFQIEQAISKPTKSTTSKKEG